MPGSSRRVQAKEGSFEIREERWFDDETRRINKRINLLDTVSGENRRYRESVRIYEQEELLSILSPSGLGVEEIGGEFEGGGGGGVHVAFGSTKNAKAT